MDVPPGAAASSSSSSSAARPAASAPAVASSSAAAAAETALEGSISRRDAASLVSALRAILLNRGGFARAQAELAEAILLAGPGSAHFALRCLPDVLAAPSDAQQQQVAALLAELGPGPEGGGNLGTEGEAVVEALARAPGQLKFATKVLEAWSAAASPGCIGPAVCAALSGAVLRDAQTTGAVAAAAAALGALPWMFDAAATRALVETVDDGSRDDVAERLAARLDRDQQLRFVERRREQGRLKEALRAAKALCLQTHFPTLEFEYRSQALAGALRHSSREAAVGLSFDEPRLHRACVFGLVDIGEAVLALELAGTWDVQLPPEVAAKAEDDAHRLAEACLKLPEAFETHFVDTEAAVASMRAALMAATSVGLDAEWQPTQGSLPSLLQLATGEAGFLVDLLALGSSQALADAFEAVFRAPGVHKVGFDCTMDLGRIGKAYPVLAHSCSRAAPVVNVRDLEADRRSQAEGLSKKRAKEGISLTSLAETYLGLPLNKSLQVCDWGRRPLSEAQAHYAALDAWVPVKVFERLNAATASRR